MKIDATKTLLSMLNLNHLTKEKTVDKYEELKLILVGDSDEWTHGEVVERAKQAIDALRREEDGTI